MGAATLGITTFSITTLSIVRLFVTLPVHFVRLNVSIFIDWLTVVLPNVVIPTVVVPNAVARNVVVPNVVAPSGEPSHLFFSAVIKLVQNLMK